MQIASRVEKANEQPSINISFLPVSHLVKMKTSIINTAKVAVNKNLLYTVSIV